MQQNLLGAKVRWEEREKTGHGTIRALWVSRDDTIICAVVFERASTSQRTVYRSVCLVELENLAVGLDVIAK